MSQGCAFPSPAQAGQVPWSSHYPSRDQQSHCLCLLQVEDKAEPGLLFFDDVRPVQRHLLCAGGFGAGAGGKMEVPVSSLY